MYQLYCGDFIGDSYILLQHPYTHNMCTAPCQSALHSTLDSTKVCHHPKIAKVWKPWRPPAEKWSLSERCNKMKGYLLGWPIPVWRCPAVPALRTTSWESGTAGRKGNAYPPEKMAIDRFDSWFTCKNCWFSIAMVVYQRIGWECHNWNGKCSFLTPKVAGVAPWTSCNLSLIQKFKRREKHEI